MKIGVFDSGIGGITVLTELRKRFSGVDYLYYGDTLHVPYGAKSAAQVERFSIECAEAIRGHRVDALVVACNTSSALALEPIRDVMGRVPVVGVVGPGVQAALNALALFGLEEISAPILILATRATVRSGAYSKTLRKVLEPRLVPGRVPCPIVEQECPLLVPMIEEGWLDHPILHQTIREYVAPYMKSYSPGVALLGCTHYPWIQPAFEKALVGWKVVNSAEAIASQIQSDKVLGPMIGGSKTRKAPAPVEWIFTDPDAIPAFAKKMIEDGNS